MTTRRHTQSGDATETTSTDRFPNGRGERPHVAGLAVVLACDSPRLGGSLHRIEGLRRMVIGRSKKGAAVLSTRDGEARLELPDAKASRDHAALERSGAGYVLRDLGSTNGTHVDEEPVESVPLAPNTLFRVGHTLLRVIPDAEPALERQSCASALWPFPTFSSELARRLNRLERVAPSQLPILISGETGTGKERVARAVHERSRRPGAFVAVNCGAIPSSLVESQLFGHKKGAFSGALQDEVGLVRAADQGTLFLDEVGDLPLAAQASLLRVLQEGEVVPIGASRPVRVDLRILCATHRPLPEMVRAGVFREDLYARLAAFAFELPPLRERREDLGILIASFLSSQLTSLPPLLRLQTDAAVDLYHHEWPRNVRELLHTIQAAAMLAEGGVVRVDDLPPILRDATPSESVPASSGGPPRSRNVDDAALREELVRRLEANGGNLAAVGREMGKARQQIQRWKRRFALK